MEPEVVVVRGAKRADEALDEALKRLRVSLPRGAVIKPNLIIDAPPPTTTPLDLVEALASLSGEAIVAEGSGWTETDRAYDRLGYREASRREGFRLVDLNRDEVVELRDPHAFTLKSFQAPRTVAGGFVISAAVLKEHSITGVSLSLKNMLGVAPSSRPGVAKKGHLHRLGVDECIADIASYVRPSLAVIDGRWACIGGELGGRPLELGVIIVSRDPVAADAIGSRLLGYEPSKVRHIVMAEARGVGSARPSRVEVVEL